MHLINKAFYTQLLVLIIRKFTLLRKIASSDIKNYHYKNYGYKVSIKLPFHRTAQGLLLCDTRNFKNTHIPFKAQKSQEQWHEGSLLATQVSSFPTRTTGGARQQGWPLVLTVCDNTWRWKLICWASSPVFL